MSSDKKKPLKVVVTYVNLDPAEQQRRIRRLAKLLLGPRPDDCDKEEDRDDSIETCP